MTDICLADNPCVSGNCTLNIAPNDYTCDCAPGFTGINCDIIGNGNATGVYLLVWPGAHEECVTSIMDTRAGHGLETRACEMLLPFMVACVPFLAYLYLPSSSLSHSPVEMQQYLYAFYIL